MLHINLRIATCAAAIILISPSSAVLAQNEAAQPGISIKGDPVAGKEKSQLCQGCHGVDGNSLSTLVPKLAGQDGDYLAKEVHNFQSGARRHRIMDDLSITVSDNDILDIAAYFSSQSTMKGNGSPTTGGIGMELFRNGDKSRNIEACTKCHGPEGKGLKPNPLMAPVIGGQNKDYLLKQLNNFRKGDRTNSPANVMHSLTQSLNDTELESLSEYISGL